MIIDPKIGDKVKKLVRQHQTRDPQTLAEALHIRVRYFDQPTRLNGLYTVILNRPIILLRPQLSPWQENLVLAHELGHHCLHRQALKELGFFGDLSKGWLETRYELEANLFAAHLLLPDEAILNALADERDLQDIAGQLNVPLDVLGIKFKALEKEYPHLSFPYQPPINLFHFE